VDIDDRVSDWRNRGWTRYEAGAPPLTEDELRREREYFAAARRQGSDLTALTKSTTRGSNAKSVKSSRGKKNAPAPAPQAVSRSEERSSEQRRAARIYSR
jgi:hypothetical protein